MLFREDIARVVRPAIFKNLVFQSISFFLRSSRINWKSVRPDGALVEYGEPKVFFKRGSTFDREEGRCS